MIPFIVEKYLRKNLSDKWKIEYGGETKFNTVIVIPALAETDNIKNLLDSLSQNDNKYFAGTLILFVINNTSSAPDNIKNDNGNSIQLLKSIIKNNSTDQFSLQIINSGLNIGLIDASSEGNQMDDKNGGVGLARKIGMDLALTVFDYSNPNKKILICLDADCKVETNYISSVVEYFNSNNVNAAVVNYEHDISGNDENTAAIICYEIYLRYYLEGLRFAGSSYAFHTIGSTMVCDCETYIKAGGMNKLKAAEDFYFLEKLSKITDIHTIKNTFVYPSSRPSFRVPFGTGQRVNRFLTHKQNEYLLYDPKVFIVLRQWLELFEQLNPSNLKNVLSLCNKINEHLYGFLTLNNFETAWQKILKQNPDQISRQKKYWFDAFKTLKLIHHLRDSCFPNINMFDALDIFFEITGIEKINRDKSALPDLNKQKEYLLLLRKLQNK